ncbi:MAG: hypothetical protein LDL24_07165 [Treponema sp.]|nr:hypothetical protein [Treponema sp.]
MSLYRIPQVNLPLDADEAELRKRIIKLLKIAPAALRDMHIERKSVDARDKEHIKLVYGVLVDVDHSRQGTIPASVALPVGPEPVYSVPQPRRSRSTAPVVVGTGPAGLFAALILAEAGLAPLVLERGDPVETRDARVRSFMSGADLDPESNIQFGEGGAGTYSDGKLTTQVKDEQGRNRKVIRELIAAGAPSEIGILAKPHVGTDQLVSVVAGLRKKIIRLGGTFRFRSRLDDIRIEGGKVTGILVNKTEWIDTDTLVLAIGHSSRDTFAMLEKRGVPMEQKSFAIGLRIEHPQEMISRSQFGRFWKHPALPVADYKLAARTSDDRGVYSFCMCPGGTVVNASSEPGGVVCNGMSDFARDGTNANAAIVVAVSPPDFGFPGLLGGVEFQRKWEQAAYDIAGRTYALPVQLWSDFLEDRSSTALGAIKPSATRGWSLTNLRRCLPAFVYNGITEGINRFGKSIAGFDRKDALLTGVETRTSSPIRILRGESCQSPIRGLYPAGEGAGYAGGIMSAAMDGIRVAEAILNEA